MTNLRVSTNAGDEVLLGSSDMEALRATLRGPLLLAGDAGYDAARTIFNAMTDHRPALIVRPAAAADVIWRRLKPNTIRPTYSGLTRTSYQRHDAAQPS